MLHEKDKKITALWDGLLNRYRVFFWDDENVLELDRGCGTTLNVPNTNESFT